MILEDLVLDQYPAIKDSDYIFEGRAVPRVTKILSEMLHEDSLMGWSNFIGRVKHQKYDEVLQEAADKGTIVHNGIEDYMQNGTELNINAVPQKYQEEVNNAWRSYYTWYTNLVANHTVEILMQEVPLVCQYYGGTLDLLLKVDGKVFLFDFKTSNHLSYKYIIQLAAYRYMLWTLHGITVDYVGIIKLDKQSVNFEEFILDCNQVDDANVLAHAENCFHYLVGGYYERKFIEKEFKERTKIL